MIVTNTNVGENLKWRYVVGVEVHRLNYGVHLVEVVVLVRNFIKDKESEAKPLDPQFGRHVRKANP